MEEVMVDEWFSHWAFTWYSGICVAACLQKDTDRMVLESLLYRQLPYRQSTWNKASMLALPEFVCWWLT